MEITVQSSKSVKPDHLVSPSTVNVIPLTVFDRANLDTHVSVIYAFRSPAPSNAVLEAGLAKALVEYREWAGRLDDKRCAILLNDAGARFVEATAGVALHRVMPLQPTAEVLSLHPRGGGDELMLIQATRFTCGSLVVGLTTHHTVTDGGGWCNFIRAWGQATRGAAIDPVPVHDRSSLFVPRSPRKIEYEHRGAEFHHHARNRKEHRHRSSHGDGEVVAVERVHFSQELIAVLKSQASAGAASYSYSTVQCVVALLWQRITEARGLDGRETTSLCIAVDGRARMRPRVPDGYTGNVVLWARPSATARELAEKPLQQVAELIHQAVGCIDDAYFKSFIDFGSSGAVEEEGLVPTADAAEMVLSPNVEVDSWVRIPFYDLDLGGGRPFFFMPSYLPVEGVVILVPSFLGDGSIDAYVPLFTRHMDAFRDACCRHQTLLLPAKSGAAKL
uniref:Uncharacterized protein n=1 Tax=Avena sativa TaxID=4498 RepID=A0ACD5UXE0_AVESA